MRTWKLMSSIDGQISILGPPLGKSERLFVVEAKTLLELMEICDRHLIAIGADRSFAEQIAFLRGQIAPKENAG